MHLMRACLSVLVALCLSGTVLAQPLDITTPATNPAAPPTAPATADYNLLLGASFANDGQVIRSGLQWRIFAASAPGTVIAASEEPIPVFRLEPGDYLIHVTYGLASASRRINLGKQARSEKLPIAAGGLIVKGTNGGELINPRDLQVAVYIPSPTNDEDKLLSSDLPTGEILRLPERTYHIVTVYGRSNSTVVADIRIQTGKVVDVTVNHKASQVTLKLVSQAGSEAIANTAWTVLTPGGDVIREELSAFPTMILAEGNYTAIARNDGRTFTGDFLVSGAARQDIEILRQDVPIAGREIPDPIPRREVRISPSARSTVQK